MKALSVVAPSGRWIAEGRKRLEVRRWAPELAPDEDLLIVENHRFLHVDGEVDPDGLALAWVRVAQVRRFLPEDMVDACASRFEDGWLAWELTAIRPLEVPVRVAAARGIYPVDLVDLIGSADFPSSDR